MKYKYRYEGIRLFDGGKVFFCPICYRFHYETNEMEGRF